MTDQIQTNAENYTSSEELDSLLPQLTYNQLRYIAIRQEFASDAEAAEAIGIKPNTVYHWPEVVGRAVRLMAHDGVHVAREMRRRALPKAMGVKVAGLDSEDEKVRQSVSTEIIEWEMGKATQPTDTKFSGEMPIKVYVTISPDDWDTADEEAA